MRVNGKRLFHDVLLIPEGTSGKVHVRHIERPAGAKLPLVNFRCGFIGGQKPPKKEVRYSFPTIWHELSEDDQGVWVTDMPIEQEQHDTLLSRVRHGRVLVGGLGLGYATTVLATRPGITQIVVVEKSPDVIRLVADATAKHLGDDARKVVFAEADLFEYLQRFLPESRPFDWAFYDIWQSDSESTFHRIVCPLLTLSRGKVRKRPICWNEDVMRGQLMMNLRNRILLTSEEGQRAWPNAARPREEFAEIHGNVYMDWTAPFFRWFLVSKAEGERLDFAAQSYVSAYGTEVFDMVWGRWDVHSTRFGKEVRAA